MKIILEFDDTEREEAHHSYNGPQLYAAALDFDNFLFQYKKKDDLSDTALAHVDEIHKQFSILFANLLYER